MSNRFASSSSPRSGNRADHGRAFMSTGMTNGSAGSKGFTSKGFTLVELLVVIGIIAVLISILLPSLAKARAQGSAVACQSQLRSIGQAILMYGNANKGSLPMGQVYLSGGSGADTDWQRLILPYIKHGASTDYATGATLSKVFHCKEMIDHPNPPSYMEPDTTSGYSAHRFLFKNTDYAANKRTPFKLTKLKRSYELILVMDAVQQLFNNSYAATPCMANLGFNAWNSTTLAQQLSPATRWGAKPPAGPNKDPISAAERDAQSCWIRWRHLGNKSANFLFADGHVAPMAWKSDGENGSRYGGSELTWNNIMPE